MKTIIAGSRYGFVAKNTFEGVESSGFEVTEVVSGGAIGVDRDGEYYAKVNQLPCTRFIPKWDELGKRAGFVRNQEMANYADALVAIWDGKSKGTEHMISCMKKLNKPTYVYIR